MSVLVGQVTDGELGEYGGKLGLRFELATPPIEIRGRGGRGMRERGILLCFEMTEIVS
ncbi:hypothetical protein [Mycobacterium uberis]|uniref:hypothetical protein n=1 Tax=Mycobacterium uberis TaxID=2162698 RepID=UPI0014041127|nr:hypothetical protein [Mycobacterium uberis]